ncbi:MAG TPA: gamma-glutamyltransferase [Candidatus Bathyarchaeia archaeon]|nr:gamma-glutamyltransferase [Candidatus Bathyarchaeia archaeon]
MKREAISKKGMVVSAHPLATKAGRDILKAGGNAVDAAIATSLTLGVVAPAWSGIGGGGFMLIHQESSGNTVALDYREVAPREAKPDMFHVDEHENVIDSANSVGYLAIAVPGQLRGYATALEEFGTMSFKQLAKTAIRHASRGYPVSKTIGKIFRENRDNATDKIVRFKALGSVFAPKGAAAKTGQKVVMTRLAASLKKLSQHSGELSYSGSIAEAISRHVKEGHGLLSVEDMESYETKVRDTVQGNYRGYDIVAMPPPSSGGITIIETLNMLEDFDLTRMKQNGTRTVHTISECLKLAFSDRGKYIGDPSFVDVPVKELIDKNFAKKRHFSVSLDKVNSTVTPAALGSHEGGSTTHLTVIDRDTNIVAATESIECYFGSGVMDPETGTILNDEMHDFDVFPGRTNSVQPGKRPLSSMSPTILFKDGRPVLALGSAAGPRIITATLQVLVNIIDFKMSLHKSVAAPRFHCEESKIFLEGGISAATETGLGRLGHPVERKPALDLYFGGVQAIQVSARGTIGMADPRRDGIALGV